MCRMVDLPAPFGPSRPVTPGPMVHRDVVDRDDVAVPAADVFDLDDGHDSAPPSGSGRPGRRGTSASDGRRGRGRRRRRSCRGWSTPSAGSVPPSHIRTPSNSVNGLNRPDTFSATWARSRSAAMWPARSAVRLRRRPGGPVVLRALDLEQDLGQGAGEQEDDRHRAGGEGPAAGQARQEQADRGQHHRPHQPDAAGPGISALVCAQTAAAAVHVGDRAARRAAAAGPPSSPGRRR